MEQTHDQPATSTGAAARGSSPVTCYAPLLTEIADLLDRGLRDRIVRHGAIKGKVLKVWIETEDKYSEHRILLQLDLGDRVATYPWSQKETCSHNPLDALEGWQVMEHNDQAQRPAQ